MPSTVNVAFAMTLVMSVPTGSSIKVHPFDRFLVDTPSMPVNVIAIWAKAELAIANKAAKVKIFFIYVV